MLTFTIRRLILSVPTLLFISLAIFLLLQLAPGDPMSQVPLTVPPEVKEKMRQALGLGEPVHVQYWKWMVQFFWIEPQVFIDWLTRESTLFAWLPDTSLYAGQLRMISWLTRGPVMDLVVQSLPQTLWVVGMSFLVGVLIALPIGIYSAYRHYSVFDQAGTFVTMIGFSIPPFFTGPLLIVIFAVQLDWFPSVYNTVHQVVDWDSFVIQLRQMILPVMVLALQTTAQISRYMRSAMLDNLNQDYVRTARAKGVPERRVVFKHMLRNAMIPLVTVWALDFSALLGGSIITETIFSWPGIGLLLVSAIGSAAVDLVMIIVVFFAVLAVVFNLLADLAYGWLDPRIRYG